MSATRSSDVDASLDELQAICPNLERVAVVVAWFGTDLRAGHCTIIPGVEVRDKATHPGEWSVSGLTRGSAHLVSTVGGRPAFGGTPSDISVVDLIGELKTRGLKVTLYPFVMMDIPAGNALPDPWTGESSQPTYPWRGRITCDPAPGQGGSPDGTATAGTQVAAFFGTAAPAHFSVAGRDVVYSGPDEWTFRRMVLHYANLAAAAGGVDAFLIGSEMAALTRVRSASGVYPAANALVEPGGRRQVHARRRDDRHLRRGLDRIRRACRRPRRERGALSARSAVGVVGYRCGRHRLLRAALRLARRRRPSRPRAGVIDLRSRLSRWQSSRGARPSTGTMPTMRRARRRRARDITDGLGKPWVFRQKDMWSWWANAHVERVGGVERRRRPSWVPQGKPIWLTEIGCPAVDKGANQPSVFPDPKSIDSGVPYFSNGRRDDFIQRRDAGSGAADIRSRPGARRSTTNPVSTVYGGAHDRSVGDPSVDLGRAALSGVSGGARRVERRAELGDGTLAHRPARLGAAQRAGCRDSRRRGRDGLSTRRRSTRSSTAISSTARWRRALRSSRWRSPMRSTPLRTTASWRSARAAASPVDELFEDDLVLPDAGAPARLTRAQETELPREVSLGFTDGGTDYRRAAVISRRLRSAAPARRTPTLPSSPMTPPRSAAPRSGCRTCGPAARRPSSRLPPIAACAHAGRRHRRHGERAAAARRAARDRRHREPARQCAAPSTRRCSSCRSAARAAERPRSRRRSDRCRRCCSICRRLPTMRRRCCCGSRCSPIRGRAGRDLALRRTGSPSSRSALRSRRRSWARRSTICLPGRPAASITSTACA